MDDILVDFSHTALVSAIESNQIAFFQLFNEWSDAEIHDSPELFWTITDIPFPLYNTVLRARLSAGNVDDYIDSAVERCNSKGVPMSWWIGPLTEPSDLGSRLSSRGFQALEAPGMAADLNSLPMKEGLPQGLRIMRVESDSDLENWCRIASRGFELPNFVADADYDFYKSQGFDPAGPYHNYIGFLDDEPVATSSLLLGAGVAGIYNVATLKEARGKGIGTAMTLEPLVEARSLGYRVGILHSSQSGYGVYRNLRFEEYCKMYFYTRSAE